MSANKKIALAGVRGVAIYANPFTSVFRRVGSSWLGSIVTTQTEGLLPQLGQSLPFFMTGTAFSLFKWRVDDFVEQKLIWATVRIVAGGATGGISTGVAAHEVPIFDVVTVATDLWLRRIENTAVRVVAERTVFLLSRRMRIFKLKALFDFTVAANTQLRLIFSQMCGAFWVMRIVAEQAVLIFEDRVPFITAGKLRNFGVTFAAQPGGFG